MYPLLSVGLSREVRELFVTPSTVLGQPPNGVVLCTYKFRERKQHQHV